jgi:predicted nucleic acid-binding protein
MSATFVLDSWALLALLQAEEPAAARVRALVRSSRAGQHRLAMSIINLGEVYYTVGRVRNEQAADQALAQLRRLTMTILPADEARVLAAARWKMAHRISYADAFAAAAARELDATLVTGDPELIGLAGELSIEPLKWSTRR